jgi:acyl transferase domain-containing protein
LRNAIGSNGKNAVFTRTNVKSWSASGLPKFAGVNAFGFGGINAHIVLKGFNAPKKDEVLLLARETHEALITRWKQETLAKAKETSA